MPLVWRLTVDVLADAVGDRSVVGKPDVGRFAVRVDRCSLDVSGARHEALERCRVGGGYHAGADLSRRPILAADERLIGLYRAYERRVLALPRFPDAVRQMPRRLLRDVEIAVQLHAGRALESGRQQVDGDGPHTVSEVAVCHRRPGLGREELAAVAAAERHARVRCLGRHVDGAAVRATDLAVRPASLNDPLLGRFVGREHVHDGHERDAVAVVLAGCLACHNGTVVTVSGLSVKRFWLPSYIVTQSSLAGRRPSGDGLAQPFRE